MDTFDFDMPGLDTTTLGDTGVPMTVRRPNSTEPYIPKPGPLGADGKSTPGEAMTLTILGMDSVAYRKVTRDQQRKMLMAQAQTSIAGLIYEMSFEEEEENRIETLVAITVGWTGAYGRDGEEIPFSKEAMAAFYRKFPAVGRQADRFAGNIANFIPAS
jgi:hypothetical protein